jgi:hypothetical protein
MIAVVNVNTDDQTNLTGEVQTPRRLSIYAKVASEPWWGRDKLSNRSHRWRLAGTTAVPDPRTASWGATWRRPTIPSGLHRVHVLPHSGSIVKHHEIEILFRRLRLYDQLERRAEGLIKTIQRELKGRYGARPRSFRNRAHAQDASAGKSSNANGPEFRRLRPKCCCNECSTKSTAFAPNGTV